LETKIASQPVRSPLASGRVARSFPAGCFITEQQLNYNQLIELLLPGCFITEQQLNYNQLIELKLDVLLLNSN